MLLFLLIQNKIILYVGISKIKEIKYGRKEWNILNSKRTPKMLNNWYRILLILRVIYLDLLFLKRKEIIIHYNNKMLKKSNQLLRVILQAILLTQ